MKQMSKKIILKGLSLLMAMVSSVQLTSMSSIYAMDAGIEENIAPENAEGVVQDLETRDENGKTPLYVACEYGNLERVKDLISKGADVNAEGPKGFRPLHVAVLSFRNAVAITKALIEAGANVNVEDREGYVPLSMAIFFDLAEVAEILVKNGADVDAPVPRVDGVLLHVAAQCNANRVLEILIKKGANVDVMTQNGLTPLHIASKFDADKAAEILINNGAKLDVKAQEGLTPMHIAAGSNAVKVANILIEKGADVDAKALNGWTPLYVAARYNADEVAKLLIERGADLGDNASNEWTLLHVAAQFNADKVANILIERGANVDASAQSGWTPLHVAAQFDSDKVAEHLIKKNANLESKIVQGLVPLQIAVAKGAKKVERLLLNTEISRIASLYRNDIISAIREKLNIELKEKFFKQSICSSWRTDPATVGEDEESIRNKIGEIDPESTFADFIFKKWNSESKSRFDMLSEEQRELLRKILSKSNEIKQNEDCLSVVKEIFNDNEDACSTRLAMIIESVATLLDNFFDSVNDVSAAVLTKARNQWLQSLFKVKYFGYEEQYDSFVGRMGVEYEMLYRTVLSSALKVPVGELAGGLWQRLKDITLDKGFILDILTNTFSSDVIKSCFLDVLKNEQVMRMYECNLDEYVAIRGESELKNRLESMLSKVNDFPQNEMNPSEKECITNYKKWCESGERLPINEIIDLVGRISVILEDYELEECNCGVSESNKRDLIIKMVQNQEGKKILAKKFISRLFEEDCLKNLCPDEETKNFEFEARKGKTPLHIACEQEDLEKVNELILKGADINAKDLRGLTPLQVAIQNNADKIVKSLIEKGANLEADDLEEGTPLYVAIHCNSDKVVKYLVEERRLDINTKSQDGITMLHVAAQFNSDKVAEFLIEKGANVNEKDFKNATPLHLAARYNSNKVAKILIEKNADLYVGVEGTGYLEGYENEERLHTKVGTILSNLDEAEIGTDLYNKVTEALSNVNIDDDCLFMSLGRILSDTDQNEAEANLRTKINEVLSNSYIVKVYITPLFFAVFSNSKEVGKLLSNAELSQVADCHKKDIIKSIREKLHINLNEKFFNDTDNEVLTKLKSEWLQNLFTVKHDGYEQQYDNFTNGQDENCKLKYCTVLSRALGLPTSDLDPETWLILDNIELDRNFIIDVLTETFSKKILASEEVTRRLFEEKYLEGVTNTKS